MSRVSGRLDALKTSVESFADNISSNKLVTEGGIPGYFKNTGDFTGTINDPQIKVKLAQMNNSSNSLTKAEVNGISEGMGNSELHHIATDKSKKFDFKNHPAFKETGINVSKDVDNLVDLANHRGRHTYKYHQEVQDRLDAVVERYGGTDKLESAVRQELNNMKQELLDGKLDPYKK